MRRFLLVVFCVVILFVPAYSQIQNEFFGYMFGSRMYHMENAMEDNLCVRQGDVLQAYDIELGGLTWNYVEMGYVNDKFCEISLQKALKHKDSASELFLHLKEKLDNKYGHYKILNSCNSKKVLYNDLKNVCMLTYEYWESNGGEMYWYLNLFYWNLKLINEKINKHNDEL